MANIEKPDFISHENFTTPAECPLIRPDAKEKISPFIDHYIVECFGIPDDVAGLNLKKYSDEFTSRLDLHVVNSFVHQFTPHGTTLVEVLSESHIAYHTWPELNYMIFDMMTCTKIEAGDKLEEYVKEIFHAQEVKIRKPEY